MAEAKPTQDQTSAKGKSPFYPGQPVPIELFVGRAAQIERIMTRGVGQVAEGKPIAIYVQGEYGIGKSSIAGFTQWRAAQERGLHGIYATLGGAHNLTDVATAVLEGTLLSGALDHTKAERLRNWLAKYVGRQDLYGFGLNFEALKADAPQLSSVFGMLKFLAEVKNRLQETGVKGVFLVLDEINGIAGSPEFAHFIKGLVDTNALASEPLPLLLMLCGVEECRREMIQKHQPIDRIFDVVGIEPMNDEEMKAFFERAFGSVQIEVPPPSLSTFTYFSAGFPKIMHLIGDAAYWRDRDNKIDGAEAMQAVFDAADEVGKKYVDQQIYKALRSEDYRSILAKIAESSPLEMSFTRKGVAAGLTESEKGKFDNFIQRMKKLNVIRTGDTPGEYVFNLRMVRLYIFLSSSKVRPIKSSVHRAPVAASSDRR